MGPDEARAHREKRAPRRARGLRHQRHRVGSAALLERQLNPMGRFDNRKSPKMRRKHAQSKKKAREHRQADDTREQRKSS